VSQQGTESGTLRQGGPLRIAREAVATLIVAGEAPHLLGFLAYVLHDPGRRRAAEVVPGVSRYLLQSRYRPDLPFEPTHGKPLVHLEWDDLEPRLREGICVEVGAEQDIGRRPGKDLESDLREFIAWRYEVLRRVRLEFTTRDHEEPPAA